MKITKYEHACLVLEAENKSLIIDPGVFTSSLPELQNVVAIVITHVHPDHFDPKALNAILTANPSAQLVTVQAVADELNETFSPVIVTGDAKVSTGPFKCEFFGTTHSIVHESRPLTDNVGILVNDTFYYPGDSFTKPNRQFEILAVPASAPWMRVGEAMDFISELKPKKVFPTHNAVLSDIGATINNGLLESATTSIDAEYLLLEPGQSTEL